MNVKAISAIVAVSAIALVEAVNVTAPPSPIGIKPTPLPTKPGQTSPVVPPSGKCFEISVERDATYCIQGPICSGAGDKPAGANCPKTGDVAIKDCLKNLKSYTDADKCVAPVDAVCQKIHTGAWGCVWPSGEVATPAPSTPCPPLPVKTETPLPPLPVKTETPCPPLPVKTETPCPPLPVKTETPCPPLPVKTETPCPPLPVKTETPCPPLPVKTETPCPPLPTKPVTTPCPPLPSPPAETNDTDTTNASIPAIPTQLPSHNPATQSPPVKLPTQLPTQKPATQNQLPTQKPATQNQLPTQKP